MEPYELSFTISDLSGRYAVRADIYGKPSETGIIVIDRPGTYKFQKKLDDNEASGEPYRIYFNADPTYDGMKISDLRIVIATDTQPPTKS